MVAKATVEGSTSFPLLHPLSEYASTDFTARTGFHAQERRGLILPSNDLISEKKIASIPLRKGFLLTEVGLATEGQVQDAYIWGLGKIMDDWTMRSRVKRN